MKVIPRYLESFKTNSHSIHPGLATSPPGLSISFIVSK